MKGKQHITWEDLNSDAIKETVAGWMRDLLRRCFLTFFPVICLVGGSFITLVGWFLQDMRTDVKTILEKQVDMSMLQSRHAVQIDELGKEVVRIKEKIFK